MVIYEIVNVVNNKRYIGQTIQLCSVRWAEHKYRLNVGKHDNPHLQYAWIKYNESSFIFNVINDTANCIEELNEMEKYYIKKYKTLNSRFGYNLREGGANGKHSLMSRKKISSALKGKIHNSDSLIKRAVTRRKTGYPSVISPHGEIFNILDLTNFCRVHNLHPTGMFDLVNRKSRQYKGWSLVGTDITETTGNLIAKKHRPWGYPNLRDPSGVVHFNITNLSKFCADHKLTVSNLSAVIHKNAKSHRGWVLADTI